jgi:hypothetical protein
MTTLKKLSLYFDIVIIKIQNNAYSSVLASFRQVFILGGAGNKPYSIQKYTLFILTN